MRTRSALIPVLFAMVALLASLFASGQGNNACGVIARISPGNDTILHQSTLIHFKNASINATDYRFLINGITFPINYDIGAQYYMDIGLHTLQLVAYNGSCTDTAVVHVFIPGKQPANRDNLEALYGFPLINQNAAGIDAVPSGGYIIAGSIHDNSYLRYPSKGTLVKTKESGCIEWSRFIEYDGYTEKSIYKVRATLDGGYAVAGYDRYGAAYLMKLDASGDPLWSHVFSTGSNYLHVFSFETTPDGGYLLTGTVQNLGGLAIWRLDASGQVVWNKLLNNNIFSAAAMRSIATDGQDVFIAGYLPNILNLPGQSGSVVIKLNYSNGQILWTKKYKTPNGDISITDIHLLPGNELLINSNAGGTAGTKPLNTFFFTDFSGNIKSARKLFSTDSRIGVDYTKMVPLKNGKFYVMVSGTEIISLQPGFYYHNLMIRMDSDSTIQWVRHQLPNRTARLYFTALGPGESFVALGDGVGRSIQPFGAASNKLVFKRIDSSGSDMARTCTYLNSIITTEPVEMITDPFTWNVETEPGITTSPGTARVVPTFTEARYNCPEFVDSCSFLKISGERSVCNISKTYTYRIHRNKSCQQPVQWEHAGLLVVQQTDSSITVKFPSFGTFKIKAVLPFSCSPIADSISIAAALKTPALNLGPDTALCVNSSIRLRTTGSYLSWEWQDGTTQQELEISQPGVYWVRVTDSCGNVFSDTLTVRRASAVPIDLGPDRIKCNADTIQIKAPPGFMNYAWGTDYNISSLHTQHVVVHPMVDTFYTLKAEKTPGCFGFDTIRVSVSHSAAVFLGNDTILCAGQSLDLDAGSSFQRFQWNTGATSQLISTYVPGTYSVIAINDKNCRSYDTVKVNVSALPAVQIHGDTTLCANGSRKLEVGPFTNHGYRWSNGSTERTIEVNALGSYWVRVTSPQGCTGTDTFSVTRSVALPSAFLPADTPICQYSSIELKSVRKYVSYLWSNQSTTASIQIRGPGLYWLQVTDAFDCMGKDSILILPVECMKGLYVPSAFTPNRDGKNDGFRPLLFGDVVHFTLRIYNRWGQVIFATDDASAAWDGRFAGILQDAGTFVWICSYQFRNEPAVQEKGTIVLLR